ncbi:BspA family leucine-rich repeat surface protein, partial [Fructobacillus papyrifericola]
MKKSSLMVFTLSGLILGGIVSTETMQADSVPASNSSTTTSSASTQADTSVVTSTWGTSPVSFDSTTGTLTVSAGTIGRAGEDISGISKNNVTKIILEDGVQAPQDSSNLFRGNYQSKYNYFEKLTSISGQLDTSNVTNMSYMFHYSVVKNLDVSNWDTSNVTNMNSLFLHSDVENLDVSNWDTSNVTNMSALFSFSDVKNLDVSNWDTSNVTDMSDMFALSVVKNLDVSNWDTSNVTNMNSLFLHSDVENLDVSNWDTSNVTDMNSVFGGVQAPVLDVSKWDTSNVTDMGDMFVGVQAPVLDVSQWNVSKVENMSFMFDTTYATTINLSQWNPSNLKSMRRMFAFSHVTTIDLTNFDTSTFEVDPYAYADVFSDSKVNTLKLGPKTVFSTLERQEFLELPEIDTSTGEYTGKWERVDPASPNSVYDSSLDFMKNYDGSMPGTYVWQRTQTAAKDLIINYQDVNGNPIYDQKIISGNVGDAFNESPVDIPGYTFKEVKDNAATSGTLSNDEQNLTFVYEKNAPTESTESKTVTQTIHYQYADGTEAADTYTKSLTFTRTKYTDAVTGEVTYGDWSSDQNFEAVKSPVLDDYTPDQAEIAAQTVNSDSQDMTFTVTYTKDATGSDNQDGTNTPSNPDNQDGTNTPSNPDNQDGINNNPSNPGSNGTNQVSSESTKPQT